jgi:hypothetical protein
MAKSGILFLGGVQSQSTLLYRDSSLYGNHGTLTNMDPATDWVFDPYLGRWVLRGDGSNDIVTTPGGWPAPPWSAATWVKMWQLSVSNVVHGIMVQYAYGGTCNSGLFYQYNAGNLWYFQAYGSGGAAHAFGTPDLSWHRFLVTASTAGSFAYLDGVLKDSQTAPVGQTASGLSLLAYTTNFCKAFVTDGMIWNRVLSLSEIQRDADPSDTMLGGLLLPPTRKWWPVSSGGAAPTFEPWWARNKNVLIGACV